MTAIAPPEFASSSTVLTLTASSGGRTVLAETLNFAEAKPQEKSPQLREKIYRDEAGVITGIEDGDYTFVVGQGDAEGIQMRSVDLILRGGAGAVDPRAAAGRLCADGDRLHRAGAVDAGAARRKRRPERAAASAALGQGRRPADAS